MALLGMLHIIWPRLGPERWLNNFIHRESFVDARLVDVRKISVGDWFRPRDGRTDWHRIAKRLNYAPRLSEFVVPTLIVCGRHDPQCPPAGSEELARGIRNGHLMVLAHRTLPWTCGGNALSSAPCKLPHALSSSGMAQQSSGFGAGAETR
jgi:pimeloyl-ACP methyl ester carboxylesterase